MILTDEARNRAMLDAAAGNWWRIPNRNATGHLSISPGSREIALCQLEETTVSILVRHPFKNPRFKCQRCLSIAGIDEEPNDADHD